MNEPNDDELEHELRLLAAEAEPVPAELPQAAVAAFGWRDIDAEIAELVYDSLLDAEEASRVRGSPGQRLVSFAVGGITIDVEVTSGGPGARSPRRSVPGWTSAIPGTRSRSRRTSWGGSGPGRSLRGR